LCAAIDLVTFAGEFWNFTVVEFKHGYGNHGAVSAAAIGDNKPGNPWSPRNQETAEFEVPLVPGHAAACGGAREGLDVADDPGGKDRADDADRAHRQQPHQHPRVRYRWVSTLELLSSITTGIGSILV